jgi:methyl-accepting chemotaxis protein
MRLKTFVLLCIGAASLTGIATSGMLIYEGLSRYAANRTAGDAVNVAAKLLAIPERLALERGPYNVVLTSDGPPAAPLRNEIDAARSGSDAAFEAAVVAAKDASYSGAPAQSAAIENLWHETKSLRDTINPMLAMKLKDRDPKLWPQLNDTMLGYNTRIIGMLDVLDPLAAASNADLAIYLDIARKSWNMRDNGGQRSSYLITAINEGGRMPASDADQISELYGRIDQDWRSIIASAKRLGDPPLLAQAIDTVRRKFFGDSFAAYSAVIAAGRGEGSYPTMVDYRTRHVPGLASTLLPRDTALRAAETIAAAGRSDAVFRLAGAIAILIFVLLTMAVVAVVFSRRIAAPLAGLTATMRRLADHDLTATIAGTGRHDEIGSMAEAVQVFKDNMIRSDALAADQESATATRLRRQAAMERHTQDFGGSVAGVMASLAASADVMRFASEEMAEAAKAVNLEAHATADGAVKSSHDLAGVAAAAEQLTSSVAEISRQVSASADVSREAVQRAQTSQVTMRNLHEATARIGEVVHLISDIAGQTNLLALNATIEAARAGDAGKGFAVVAGEVKALAAQTAKATSEIGDQIDAMRGATAQAVSAMSEIGAIIGRINEVASAISAAVEQQSATTKEIAASVQSVSGATEQTAQTMRHVVELSDNAGAASGDVLSGAVAIGEEAEKLRTEVERFLVVVRSEGGERRRYERIDGRNAQVVLRQQGREGRYTLLDLSRGGARLTCDWNLAAGVLVRLELPNAGGTMEARAVRCDGHEIALVFTGDAAGTALVDRALDALSSMRDAA